MIFGNTPIQLVYKFLIFLGVVVIVYLLSGELALHQERKWIYAIFFGLALAICSVFCLQGHSYIFAEEAGPISRIRDIKSLFTDAAKTCQEETQGFTWINTTNNLKLIDDPYSTNGANIAVTDRNLLTRAINYLARQSGNFDLVVCDLVFPDASSADSGLVKAFNKLAISNKLVLAYSHDFEVQNPAFYRQLDRSVLGDVTKVKNERFYFSNELTTADNLRSLPYAMYLKLRHLPAPENGWWIRERDGYASRNLITEFTCTDETLLYPGLRAKTDQHLVSEPRRDLVATEQNNFYTLGEITQWDTQLRLQDAWRGKPDKEHPRIIFIGNLTDPQIDKHETAYGSLHGGTILLNEFLYVWKGYHIFSWIQLLRLVALEWLMYSGLFYYIFCRNVRSTYDNKAPGRSFLGLLKDLGQFFLDELHYVILLFIALAISLLYHRLTNIMALLYIIVPFTYLLEYFMHRHIRRQHITKTCHHE